MNKNMLILVATACMAMTFGVLVSIGLNARSLNQKPDIQPDLNDELSQRSLGSLPIAKAGTTVPVSNILSQTRQGGLNRFGGAKSNVAKRPSFDFHPQLHTQNPPKPTAGFANAG